MVVRKGLLAAGLGLVAVIAASSGNAQTPKKGGTLTFMIPADSPPSFDGHRETTFATVHATAPFYSVLIRVPPDNPASTTEFVCDLCTEMPKPTDDGKTYTFKIRPDVKWHDGSKLTAKDVAASWNRIVFPPPGVTSARVTYYAMVDKIEAPDDNTVVFRLKRATTAFLPALADPFTYIYKKEILDKDQKWYEKNIMGSGPFKFASYEIGQSIKGVRNPDYYHKGQPYLDAIEGIFADKQSVRVEAIRGDRAAMEFRGMPPSARDQLVKEAGKDVVVQDSDWNCGNIVSYNHKKKPFDDVRVRRALSLAVDHWGGAPALSKIAIVRTPGGIVFPGSPLAANKEELQQIAGFWPDIEKSRAEAKRLLKEAGHENLKFELTNRNVDQPYKFVGTWLIGEWKKIGVTVEQKVVPTGPWFAAMRGGTFDVVVDANCQSVVNPVLDTAKYLPKKVYPESYGDYDDPKSIELYNAMTQETDPAKQRAAMRAYEKHTLDTEAHSIVTPYWYRILVIRSYVKGWKISPSHYLNQDLANVWLDK
ncbi:MAG: ABC transporter substrate-binding protein [Reyranella sp.]|uniref:ABC transporter substrate-binding protein n=1 Tax=Reyranella sp. TaxID=1929291 RepID=UPI00272FF63F|nr:ABC transporter substrate-binding protein [Reyranella sp.]MDP1964626.1 ABC transporter substrate-binding protein [Reyranella sp.]MDP2373003.1 ABC transporter substrate-binding protein [Reyranella sp.]